MKLSAIYEKDIARRINPAIAAGDLSEESIKIEIEEYIFTDEIINNLYRTLLAIKDNKSVSKTGIWINGYYGSGKSHFLKYLHYCVNPQTREKAFARLTEAVKKRDPLLNPDSNIYVNNSDISTLRRWYETAEIEDILFNAQDVTKAQRGSNTFTFIFFNMFNRCRGYNWYNIPLALLFEKYLDKRDKLNEFKVRLKEQTEFNWDNDAADIVATELDTALAVAKECVPQIDIDSLKTTLLNPQTYHIDTVKFSNEVKEYINSKGANYRMLFLVDEVSQYVNDNQELLLDLQTIVERLSADCSNQAWIACTAQQTIEDVANYAGITSTSDNYGKIMGRFETRVSLESTDPAYITQERILEKNSQGLTALHNLYKSKEEAILNQFGSSHELYGGFKNEDEFVRSYPFIPYQFKLISQVFESFQRKEFVVKEVKDNERSILKITHETAKRTMDWEVGSFIPFDEFYNNMLQQNLIHKGTRAINPTMNLDFVKKDDFAKRVVKTLFMISNLEERDQLLFKPTLDNLTLLLMESVDENKMLLRDNIDAVLHELVKKNMIREEKGEYYFYNEDEAELSTIIKNNVISLEARVDIIRNILFPHIAVESKYRFASNDFKLMATIDGRNYFASTNHDVQVSFLIYERSNAEEYALGNSDTNLVVCLSELFDKDSVLKESFDWYCKVEDHLSKNLGSSSGVRKKSLEVFSQRNKTLYENKLKQAFYDMFDKSRFISGQTVIEAGEIPGKGRERYRKALDKHFSNLYKYAGLVDGMPTTQEELRNRANESFNPGSYGELNPMNEAERRVNEYIMRVGNEIQLNDLLQNFYRKPYGWRDTTTIYLITELVKRGMREIKYKHQLRFPIKDFVTKALITSERSSLSITSTQKISQELINDTTSAWANIFNEFIPSASDGNLLFEDLTKKLKEEVEKWRRLKSDYENYPFSRPLSHLTETLNEWLQIRDPKRLFETLIEVQTDAAAAIDICRQVDDFIKNNLESYDAAKRFYNTNHANFDGLDEADRSKAKQMSSFFEKENPTEEFHIIKKIHRELQTSINEVIKLLRTNVIQCYKELFDRLNDLANANQVPAYFIGDKEHYLKKIEKEKEILQLRLYMANIKNFEDDNRAKILTEADRLKQIEEAKRRPTGVIFPPEAAESPVEYSLPKANKVLETKADVDNYIETLRTNLMEVINNKKRIIIK